MAKSTLTQDKICTLELASHAGRVPSYEVIPPESSTPTVDHTTGALIERQHSCGSDDCEIELGRRTEAPATRAFDHGSGFARAFSGFWPVGAR